MPAIACEPASRRALLLSFLRACLEPDPARRPTAAQLLAHPFFTTDPAVARILRRCNGGGSEGYGHSVRLFPHLAARAHARVVRRLLTAAVARELGVVGVARHGGAQSASDGAEDAGAGPGNGADSGPAAGTSTVADAEAAARTAEALLRVCAAVQARQRQEQGAGVAAAEGSAFPSPSPASAEAAVAVTLDAQLEAALAYEFGVARAQVRGAWQAAGRTTLARPG
jgi:hypothetical protein